MCYTVPTAAAIVTTFIWKKNRSLGLWWLLLLFYGGALFGVIDHLWNGELFLISENWVRDFAQLEDITIDVDEKQKAAIMGLVRAIEGLKDSDDIQTKIFETAREHDIKPRDFFKLLYQILLNTDRGPKLGPYIQTIGIEQAIETLKRNLE